MSMWPINISAIATTSPVSRDEMKMHLRVDSATEDDLIDAINEAAASWVEGYLNRPLLSQSFTATFAGFPGSRGKLELPRMGVSSLTSIAYLDTNDASQTLSASLYTLVTGNPASYVIPAYGQEWPTTIIQYGRPVVTVVFVAGYAASTTPQPIISAIKLIAGTLYEMRESEVTGTIISKTNMHMALLDMYRVHPV